MKIKKVTINQEAPILSSSVRNDTFLYDLYYSQKANKLIVNLIEIEANANPSDFIFVIKKYDDEEKIIPLYLYKTKMVLMGNKFCWNVTDNDDFVFNASNFSIRIEGEVSEFSIDFYYSTDQKIPYTLFTEEDERRDFTKRICMQEINYDLKFTVGDVARIFKMQKDIVKAWCFKFSDYLSKNANPVKGKTREFTLEDIRVFAYVFMYWEGEPDIEHIKYGLNSNSHYDMELIDNLITQITPLFMDLPEDIDETWKHGVVYGGLAEVADAFFLANSYKIAGGRLIETALKNEEGWELFCPAIYNYRHAMELYMKAIIGKKKEGHNLLNLLDSLKYKLKKEFDAELPGWFEKIVLSFHNFDPEGTSFRYGGKASDEVFVDFIHAKKLMNWASELFKTIRRHQGLPY